MLKKLCKPARHMQTCLELVFCRLRGAEVLARPRSWRLSEILVVLLVQEVTGMLKEGYQISKTHVNISGTWFSVDYEEQW